MSKPIYTLPQIIHELRSNQPAPLNFEEYRDWSDEAEVTFKLDAGDQGIFGGGDDIIPMTAHQKTMAKLAFELWDDVAAIDIRQASPSETTEVTFAYTSDVPFTDGPAATDTTEEWFGTNLAEANVWFEADWSEAQDSQVAFGKYGFYAYLHEIGHALGLTHPGDYNGSADYGLDAEYAQDTGQYTLMSYFNAGSDGSAANHNSAGTMNYSAAPMLHDIAAMQAIYGADMTTRTGDTVYGFNSNAGKVIDGQNSIHTTLARTSFRYSQSGTQAAMTQSTPRLPARIRSSISAPVISPR